MSNSKLPYVSVIITAYNRKEFLLNAIKSATDQTLDKEYYEIIVIKNYKDDMIDNYIQNNKIIGVISNQISISGKLVEALNIARGTVISFLDDDDLFSKDKLEIVYNKFKDNDDLCYYHNGHITINDEYRKLNSNRGHSIVFNLSSISVRKSVLNLDNLKKIEFNLDDYMYLSALESKKNITAGKEKLTYYMAHTSASHIHTDDIDEFIRYRNINSERVLKNFMILSELFTSKKANNYIKQKITNIEIDNYLLDGNVKPSNVLNIFKKGDMSLLARIEIFMAYILVVFNHNFRNIMIKELLNKNKKP